MKPLIKLDHYITLIFFVFKGHRNLWTQKYILHRDISTNNVLLGQPKSLPGSRGILIDLDMAIRIDQKTSLKDLDFKTVSSSK